MRAEPRNLQLQAFLTGKSGFADSLTLSTLPHQERPGPDTLLAPFLSDHARLMTEKLLTKGPAMRGSFTIAA